MNIFRFGDFGQTFLGFNSCICWINDVNSLTLAPPPSPPCHMHLNIDQPLTHVK